MTHRYVVLGLGSTRSLWMSHVAAWSTAGALPVEFSKCVSAAELCQRLKGLRPYSAVMVESLDETVLTVARDAHVPVLLLTDRPTSDARVAATLSPSAGPGDLLGVLAANAAIVADSAAAQLTPFDDITPASGELLTVCGPGGTGASTLAIALAQQLAKDVLNAGLVALVDMARNGEQGMLHDATDVVPGVEELMDLHRNRRPTVDQVQGLTFTIPNRGYDLLLGVRRPAAWIAIPPGAPQAALDSLQRAYRVTVADVTADFEGEAQTGSRDVEDRNAISRACALQAEMVFIVGTPTMKGVHSTARVVAELLELGVGQDRLQVVINRTPKRFIGQHEVKAALAGLITAELPQAIFVKDHNVEAALRDGAALPAALGDALVACRRRIGPPIVDLDRPQPVAPGTLVTFEEAAG